MKGKDTHLQIYFLDKGSWLTLPRLGCKCCARAQNTVCCPRAFLLPDAENGANILHVFMQSIMKPVFLPVFFKGGIAVECSALVSPEICAHASTC